MAKQQQEQQQSTAKEDLQEKLPELEEQKRLCGGHERFPFGGKILPTNQGIATSIGRVPVSDSFTAFQTVMKGERFYDRTPSWSARIAIIKGLSLHYRVQTFSQNGQRGQC